MIQYSILRLITGVIHILPLNFVRLFSYPLGIIHYVLSIRSTLRLVNRTKYFKQSNVFSFSPLKVKIFYTQYWIEILWLNKKVSVNPEKYVTFEEPKVINRFVDDNKGFIIALPHQGNWEFAIPAGKSVGLDLVAVAEPLSNKKILDWFINLRTLLGCKIVIGGSKSNTYDNIKNEILNGKAVCLVSERHIDKSGAPVDFFGKIAAFPTGPINLAIDTGCPILPTTCLSTKEGFKIFFGKPFYVPKFGNNAQSLQNGLKTLATEFEYLISLDPNQWHSTVAIWSDE